MVKERVVRIKMSWDTCLLVPLDSVALLTKLLSVSKRVSTEWDSDYGKQVLLLNDSPIEMSMEQVEVLTREEWAVVKEACEAEARALKEVEKAAEAASLNQPENP